MVDKEEIKLALAAHSVWRTRLKQAIDAGALDTDIETLALDDRCSFGKWLNSLEPEDQAQEHFRAVKVLHAKFHTIAAQVGEHALRGKVEAAQSLLAPEGEYTAASERLRAEMAAWLDSLP